MVGGVNFMRIVYYGGKKIGSSLLTKLLLDFINNNSKIYINKEIQIMNILKKVLFLGIFSIVFLGGIQTVEAQTYYFVREGFISRNPHADGLDLGEFSSPHNTIIPYLQEEDRGFLTLIEVESYLRSYNFTNAQITNVRNLLRNHGTSFLYYLNADNYYRWIWIIIYQ
jgi:hypothetical protein